MYRNDFVTSIISTNVRDVLNDSFGSRSELVQKRVRSSSVSTYNYAAPTRASNLRKQSVCANSLTV